MAKEHNRNLQTSKVPLKSQAQGTSLFTSTASNQRGCPKNSTWEAKVQLTSKDAKTEGEKLRSDWHWLKNCLSGWNWELNLCYFAPIITFPAALQSANAASVVCLWDQVLTWDKSVSHESKLIWWSVCMSHDCLLVSRPDCQPRGWHSNP